MHRIAYGARQLHGGRRDQNVVILLIHQNDSSQRMPGFLARLDILNQVDDFIAMLLLERPSQREIAAGIMIMYPVAGRAKGFVRALRFLDPLPTPLVKHRAAFAACGGFRQFTSGFVGIVLVFPDQAVTTGWAGTFPVYSYCSCHGCILLLVMAMML
jgi:hypothetical protein